MYSLCANYGVCVYIYGIIHNEIFNLLVNLNMICNNVHLVLLLVGDPQSVNWRL